MSKPVEQNQNSLHSKSQQLFNTQNIKNDLKGRAVRGGAITISAQGLKFCLTLISNIWLARLLTPDDYGLVGMVTVIINFVTQFKTLGLSMATVQKEEVTHQQVSTLFWINVAIAASITLLAMLCSPVVVWFYAEPRLSEITIALAAGVLISGLGIQHAALLKRHMRYTQLAINELLSLSIGLGVALWAARSGLGYWALVIYPVTKETISTMGYWIVSGWIPGRPRRGVGVRAMLSFGGNLAGFSVLNYLARNLDNFAIGKVWGTYQLGLYAKAYQLFIYPLNQIIEPLTSVAVPLLSRLTSSPQKFRSTYLRFLEKVLLITMPLAVFMIVSADWLVDLLLGPNWQGIVPIFRCLGIVGFLRPIGSTTGWLFISQGKTDRMFKWSMVGTLITMVSFFIGLPWGAVGVATSYALMMTFVNIPLLLWYVGKNTMINTKDYYITMLPILLASLVTVAVLFAARSVWPLQSSLVSLALAFLMTISMFLVVLICLPKGKGILLDVIQLLHFIRNKK